MDKFNEVFLAIKKRSQEQTKFAELHDFKQIAQEAGITQKALEPYLKRLCDRGLIEYSAQEQYIYLTSLGKELQGVSMEQV